ncbi:hypothetical protein BGV56_00910 [Burkholderia ubonensis]|uniref:hypothetical protein n=1 Tax=Burkholderia ubonensis TaxID=101571 RepID=UPI0008FDE50A|nr:hypothetical protein [Burkholderia ubonensis]OJB40386.1 hypothetical protein BGV56_00910 [Burkholderia ubonensis]
MGSLNMQELQALVKAALAADMGVPLNKANTVTTATGLVSYDLQAPAKNLYPVLTPIRNSLPRVQGRGDTATRWKVIRAIQGSGFDSIGFVPEGQRAGRMSYSAVNALAAYATLGEEESVTFEAESAGREFEDVRATAAIRLLQKMMMKEEDAILGSNLSIALGTPAAPTVSSAGTGGTVGAGTYNVIVVALAYTAYRVAAVSASGVPTSSTISGADGQTFTLNSGSSNKSAATSTGALSGSTSTISASVAPVAGAVAYAWYVGTTGNETLQAITTINSVKLTSLSTSNQNASAITADCSQNSLGFDGLLSWALNPTNGAYVNTFGTGTAGTGVYLTASSRGSINEMDTAFRSMWDLYRVSPDLIYVNAQEYQNILAKVLNSTSGPLLRFNTQSREPYAIFAGGSIEAYFNPFAANGGYKVPILIHPTLPPGTILFWTQNLPMQYQNNEVPQVAEVHLHRDYYEIDWPLKTRAYEMGVYAEEVLAVYAPFAMGVLNNIGNG